MKLTKILAAFGVLAICYLAWRGAAHRPIIWPWRQAEHQQQMRRDQELSNLTQEPFFQSLSKKRQAQVREAALVAQTLRDIDLQEMETSGLTRGDKVYDADGVKLRADELDFLRRRKLVLEPTWPGYKTYRGQGDIFILVPEPEAVEVDADSHDDDTWWDRY